MTDVIRVDPSDPDPAQIARAAERLRRGALVAFPTETVYGLGAHAFDRAAVRRLFDAKARPANDPLIVHINSIADAGSLVAAMPDDARVLAGRFWPGPLTLVLRRSPLVPDDVTAGLDTVGVRVPAHPVARALIEAAGIPIAAPSANLFSRPSPTRAAHVLEDLEGRIDLVLDGGPTPVGVESTVLDLSRETPTILRPGAVTLEMLRGVLPRVESRASSGPDDTAMPSPGLLSRHYSPRAPLTLYEGDAAAVLERLTHDAGEAVALGKVVGIIAADQDRLSGAQSPTLRVIALGSAANPATTASRLYAALRELDAIGVDLILARSFPVDTGLGVAIQDRLRRAAAGRIVRC